MKKKHISPFLLLLSLGIALLHLFCDLPSNPSDPQKTNVSVIFKHSSSPLDDTIAIDSVGKPMFIGAVLYLPSNFEALNFKIIENSNIILDKTIDSFSVDHIRDTFWLPYTFSTPGEKTLTLTSISTPVLAPVTVKITILGTASANVAPKWSVDTLRKTVNVGTMVSQALSEICLDPENDPITYSLTAGEIENDTIIGNSYQFTSVAAGVFIAHINAADPEGKSGILPVKITVDTASTLTYSVTYQKAGDVTGDVPIDTKKYQSGEPVTIPGNGNLVKTGFTFAGWNTLENGNGIPYLAGSTLVIGTTDVVLHAQWTTNATFTVTFNSNGGTGTMANQSIMSGVSIPLSANVFTNTGSVFAGWTTTATGTTVEYTDMAPYKMGTSDVILYALWSQNPLHKISYNNNGGTGTMADQSIASGMTAPLVANTFKKAGSTFAGWVTTATGTTVEYADNASYTMGNSDVTLYALWKQNASFLVTFDKNDASATGTTADLSIVSGLSATLTTNGFSRVGYKFTGWNTAKDGTGTAYAPGAAYTMGAADVTLYAQWKIIQYTLTYDGNSPSTGSAPAAATYDSNTTVTLAANIGVLAKDGFTFSGWNSAADGTGTAYVAGTGTLVIRANTILYARWTAKSVAPSITTQPVAKSVNPGASVSFTAEINADVYPAPTYIRWVKNNTDTIASATTLTLSLSSVSYSSAGNYKVVVKNGIATAVSNNAALTVNDMTSPILSLTGAADTTILLGSTWTDPKGTATDDRDGNISATITLTGAPANTNAAGRFTITYKVSDAAGNAATAITRTLRIEGWEAVTTIAKSSYRNAVMDGAENIYIASDQSVYKVSNGTAVEINTYALAKDLCVAVGSDKSSIFTYATVSGLIQKYNGSLWTDFGKFGLNSIQASSINIGPGNDVYLSGGYPIFMQIVSIYTDGTDGYQLGDVNEGLPLSMTNGKCTSKNFCVTTNSDVYTIGLNYSGDVYEVVAGKYTHNGGTWAFQTLEVSNVNCYDLKVVNYGSTGYIGYTKGNANPTIWQSGSGTNWTKIPSSIANDPTVAGGMDIAVSPTGELHAAYIQGTNILVKKYVNSSWQNIPNCKMTAAFTGTATNPYLLPGTDACYIVYNDDTKIYIKKWKKQ